MWFLRGRPTTIDIDAAVESVDCGYQRTTYRFKIAAEPETTLDGKVWIGLPIPWAPHKENGAVKVIDNDFLDRVAPAEDVETITNEQLTIWERLRAMKREEHIELVHVQELINWHLDDFGVATAWVETDKTYQVSYQHKIASDSCLFVPTRLPTVIASHQPTVNFNLWVVNGLLHDLPKQVVKESATDLDGRSVVKVTFSDWDWGEDTRFHTDNWESSDDEESSE